MLGRFIRVKERRGEKGKGYIEHKREQKGNKQKIDTVVKRRRKGTDGIRTVVVYNMI